MSSKGKISLVKYKETRYVRTQSCFRNHSPAGHYCLSGVGWWADLGQKVSQYQRIWCPSDRNMRNRSSANDTSIPGVGKAIRDVFPVALRTLNAKGGSVWLFGGVKPPEWGTAHPQPQGIAEPREWEWDVSWMNLEGPGSEKESAYGGLHILTAKCLHLLFTDNTQKRLWNLRS